MRETKNNPLRGHELDFVTVFFQFSDHSILLNGIQVHVLQIRYTD